MAGGDAVIDVVGGPAHLIRSYRALRPGGRLLMPGMAGTTRHGMRIILRSLLVTAILAIWSDVRRIATGPGTEKHPHEHMEWYRDTLAKSFDLAVQGLFEPHLAARIPLSEAPYAHRMLENGQVAGKLVLVTGA